MLGPDGADVRTLFINGTVGSGKTTTAEAIGEILERNKVAHAVIDLDALSQFWPPRAGDRFNLDLEIANLESIAANFREAGATRFIVSGVIERAHDRARYENAVEAPMFVCRLVVPWQELQRRLMHRHAPGPKREWHLHRAIELEAVLEAAELGDVLVHSARTPPDQVANHILEIVGWS